MTLVELEQLDVTQREELYSSMDGYNSSFVKSLIDNDATAIRYDDAVISPTHFDIGNLIEYLIQRGDKWVRKHIYFTDVKKPENVIGQITEYLLQNADDAKAILNGDVDIAKELATRFGYGADNWKAETILKKFIDGGMLTYLEAVKEAAGRPIMAEESLFLAEAALNRCYAGSLGEEMANFPENDGWKYLDQVPVAAELEVPGLEKPVLFKILIDRLVYHPERMIYRALDFKSMAYCASTFKSSYLKLRYWVQGGLYIKVLSHWLEETKGNVNIMPFTFIPISKAEVTTLSVPFEMSNADVESAWHGWIDMRSQPRVGIAQAIFNREKLMEMYPNQDAPYPVKYDAYQKGRYSLRELY